jgi:phage-related protein
MAITTISMLLHQLVIIVPSIIAAITAITGAINGAFDVQNGNVKHLISWIVAVLCGILTVLTGGLSFGLGYVDYIIGAVFGLIAGGASNGLYDWPVVGNIVDKLYYLFGNGETIERKKAKLAK